MDMKRAITSLLVVSLTTPLIVGQAEAGKGKLQLVASKTSAAIEIDGKAESLWENAKPTSVLLDEMPYKPNNGYEGVKKTTVEMRALYDEQYIYMQFKWSDPTVSLARFPWQKQEDGSWKILKNLDSTLHENTYYEDKFSIYWNINERGFAKKGCDKSCHMVEKGLLEGVKDTSSGRHYTLGGSIDEWHWKSTRTNINQQMDDGFVDSEHETNEKWGRHADPKTGGGYFYNKTKGTAVPAWMSERTKQAASSDPIYHLLDSEKTPFVDDFKAGDVLPGIVTAPFEGGRADVTAKGHWQDGAWTLEIKRKLVTGDSPEMDLQFSDLSKSYRFGVTAFDNSQIAHIYHNGSVKLVFE